MKLALALALSLSLSVSVSLLATGCVAGNAGTGDGTGATGSKDLGPDGGGGTTVRSDGGTPKADGGAASDASTSEAVPLTPHYDITINGTKAPVTQLFLNKELTGNTTGHAPSIQGLFQGGVIPFAESREAGMWLELNENPKGVATCDKIDLTIDYYLAGGGATEARPVHPGGWCTVTITEAATGLWTAGTVSGVATSYDGSKPITFSLNWAQKTVE